MSTLAKWKEKLLDLGRKNKLLNYRETKAGCLSVVYPDVAAVFKKLTGDTPSFEVFDTDGFLRSARGKRLKKTDAELFAYAQSNVKRSQIMLSSGDESLRTVMRTLSKKANSSISEQGINVLYIAFGFLKWNDKASNNEWFTSPLVLVPVALRNDSVYYPYYLEQYEDEAVTNPTLTYKLSSDHNIKLPQIEDGEGMAEYLDRIAEFSAPFGWSVTRDMKISLFSFMKMNMYLDVKNNESEMLKNENIRLLSGERLVSESAVEAAYRNVRELEQSKNGESKRRCEEGALHNVVDADSSQCEAIRLARSGESFVLQGPPGTGKSQTITNIIAECLYDGKKILFVSEKQAALNIVYNNLKKVSLSDFCLELHSHQTNKRDVIAELDRVLKKSKSDVSGRAKEELGELSQLSQRLDTYVKELHTPVSVLEMTPYAVFGEIACLSGAKEIPFVIQSIETKGKDHHQACLDVIDQYSGFVSDVGKDFRENEWYGFKPTDMTFEQKLELKKHVDAVASAFSELVSVAERIAKRTSVEIRTVKNAVAVAEIFSLLSHEGLYSQRLTNIAELKRVITEFEICRIASDEIKSAAAALSVDFTDALFNLKGEELLTRYRQYGGLLRVFNKGYKEDVSAINACLKNPEVKLRRDYVIRSLEMLADIQRNERTIDGYDGSMKELIGNRFCGANTEWSFYIEKLSELSERLASGVDISRLFISLQPDTSSKDVLCDLSRDLEKAMRGLNGHLEHVYGCFDPVKFDIENSTLQANAAKLGRCAYGFKKLDNWLSFSRLFHKAEELSIDGFIALSLDEGISSEELRDCFSLLFFEQWGYYILSRSEVLNNFSRVWQDKCVLTFADKDRLQFEISKAQINAKLSSERPNMEMIAMGSPVALLEREAEKTRKQMPVRTLIGTLTELVQTLKPCFLMSPLSVSAYLDAKKIRFDTVIFDEASQIFPEDALGAIFRADQVIVVGDSKQMPPSNFFASTVQSDEDDGEDIAEDVADFESILDICATCMKQKWLSWHYRSRNEDLISFSNRHFYNNGLVTFPSARRKETYYGVDLCYVNEGCYDRDKKMNIVEANKTADLVFEHFDRYPDRSIGVVAFSQSQQECIDEVISSRRDKNGAYEKFFSSRLPEPFFVKNLETVQGDERDTIIFSVGYARDKSGKFLMNFGPLNRQGGERRLNVAVTRAKYNVVVVSSVKYSDIDTDRTDATGAKLLREYLYYAEHGAVNSFATKESGGFFPEYGLADAVCGFLADAGYSVEKDVGSSSQRIDIAVRHTDGDRYVLAIECDGETYRNCRSTRDRDRLRREVLERYGWNYYRIWSTDWFRNNEVEKARLIAAVNAAIDGDDGKSVSDVAREVEIPVSDASEIDLIASDDNPANAGIADGLTQSETADGNTLAVEGATVSANGADKPFEKSKRRINTGNTWANKARGVQFIEDEREKKDGDVALRNEKTKRKSSMFEIKRDDRMLFEEYRQIDVDSVEHNGSFSKVIESVVFAESPVSEEWLLKRTAHMFGRGKVTTVVKEQFSNWVARTRAVSRGNGFLFRADDTKPFDVGLRIPAKGGAPRDMRYIATEEIANGMETLIGNSMEVTHEGLFKTVAAVLGFSRVGEAMTTRMNEALRYLQKWGKIVVDGDRIMLAEKEKRNKAVKN